jgi:hypothetical protein
LATLSFFPYRVSKSLDGESRLIERGSLMRVAGLWGGLLACASASWGGNVAWAQDSVHGLLVKDDVRIPSVAPVGPVEVSPAAKSGHPLEAALEFAQSRYAYLQQNVRDFTCLLVKRERIEGKLRGYEYIQTRTRLRKVENGKTVVPLSVAMKFLSPPELKDRRVLFVEGQNNGKMLVRNGGKRFSYVTVRLLPDSDAALREGRYPITELSLETVARRMMEKAEDDVRFDPAHSNTQVAFFRGAKVDGRSCTRIQVTHPRRDVNFSFHIANVFVDDQLNVPIRVEGYDWPETGSTDPVLLEEYTFTKLRLNVGLTDRDFLSSFVEE